MALLLRRRCSGDQGGILFEETEGGGNLPRGATFLRRALYSFERADMEYEISNLITGCWE